MERILTDGADGAWVLDSAFSATDELFPAAAKVNGLRGIGGKPVAGPLEGNGGRGADGRGAAIGGAKVESGFGSLTVNGLGGTGGIAG